MMQEVTSENQDLKERIRKLEEAITRQEQAAEEAVKQSAEEAAKEPAQEPAKEAAEEPTKEAGPEAVKEAAKDLKKLEERVKELEAEKAAREEATRSIIQQALSKLGSKISECCTFGGTFEVLAGANQVFDGRSERVLRVSTAQLDFEIQANDWTSGTIVVQFVDGRDTLFLTSEGSEKSVDRITLDTAFLTLGDPQRFPLFLRAGKIFLPFGISTGNPVADVLTIQDPLTIEAFETKEDAILIGVGLPTPPLTPATPPVTPPRVRPLVINPLISSLMRSLGYSPPPTRPPPPTPITLKPAPPPFNAGVYFYNGNTQGRFRRDWRWRPTESFGATVGFRTKGHCGRPYDQLGADGRWLEVFCPWSIDIDIDYNNSVFDSLFLESEYRNFLPQIGLVPGMAAHVKSTLGPVSLVAEWNGAISPAKFRDDSGRFIRLEPGAWQITLGYQFDWNPWVEAIGAQGTYLAIGYSESQDLAGVRRVIGGTLRRVGSVPKRRFIVGAGEWVLDNVRLAIEYSFNVDYSRVEGGTDRTAHGVFLQLTIVW